MADTIRVTQSNIVVLETSSPAADTELRITKSRIVILTNVTDVNLAPPAGRSAIIMI